MNLKLDKKAKSVIVVYSIVLFVYILAFLVVPFNKNATSWISFAFTIIAIICSLLVCGRAFNSKEKLVSKIYGFPIFRVGIIYALVQLILGIIICAIGAFTTVPSWIAWLVSIILLGIAAIGVIITDSTRDMIEGSDEAIIATTKNVTFFQIDIASIVDMCEDSVIKSDLKVLNDLFLYSDPVTNESTKESEDAIKSMLVELKILIVEGNTDDIKALIKKITNALNERNRICKVSKV